MMVRKYFPTALLALQPLLKLLLLFFLSSTIHIQQNHFHRVTTTVEAFSISFTKFSTSSSNQLTSSSSQSQSSFIWKQPRQQHQHHQPPWGQPQQLQPKSMLWTRRYLSSTDDDEEIEFEEEELIDDDEEEGETAEEGDEEDDEIMNSIIDSEYDDEDDEEYDDDLLIEEEDGDESLVAATAGRRKGSIDNSDSFNDDDYDSNGNDGIDWDVEEDGIDYELIDEMDDPDYVQQKRIVDTAIQESELRMQDDNFDPLQFLTDHLTPETSDQLDQIPFFQHVEAMTQDMTLTDEDLIQSGITEENLEASVDAISDLMEDDPYPRHNDEISNLLQQTSGITDDDMIELDQTYKDVQAALNKEPWDKVMLRAQQGFDHLPNQTVHEIDECLGEIGGSAYNVTNWLLYDLDFNVSNLILSAIQHNKHAPILFHHWYPQLVVYERYQHARDRNFDFTWEDVEQADSTELQRYYAGFGYDEIPSKAPAETGIINLDELDEEDIKMAAFENWMTDVYNPEMDRKDFDDDTMRDEDNVFSDFYEYPQHPDLPSMEDVIDDIEQFQYENIGMDNANKYPDVKEYRDMMGQTFDYEVVQDEEFVRDFRGHVIIACTGHDTDLEMAERITLRFEQEFGKQVYVETRIMALAREDDNVYEIWIESYDIELLHSKKRAVANIKGWTGPAEIDDAHIEFLTNRVRFLISDDARYSYRMELDLAD